MEQDILDKIEEQGKKVDAIYTSVEKTRKYFFWTMIITIATIVIPLVILMLAIPFLMNTLSSAYGGLL
jgi:CHASE3 domain sensor protein